MCIKHFENLLSVQSDGAVLVKDDLAKDCFSDRRLNRVNKFGHKIF